MNFKVIIFGANELLAYLADVAVVEVHLLDDARLPVRNQGCEHHTQTSVFILHTYTYTVCPGSSDPQEKIFNIFASENEVYTIYYYYDTLG